MLGELPEEVRLRSLQSARAHLAEEGRIVICDELWPRNELLSLLYYLLYAAFALPNFLLTRTMVRPVKNLPGLLAQCGLQIVESRRLLLGALSILHVARSQRP